MISDRITKKTLETLGGIGSIGIGLLCVFLSVLAHQKDENMWEVWTTMSVIMVVNGIAMILHARKRDDSLLMPEGLHPMQHSMDKAVKGRT